MLRYLFARQLKMYPRLADGMFRDRAAQFKTRLNWEVSVNALGEERDSYDSLNPLYVIWERADGSHGGSMRFLPTTGPTMINDHFLFLNDGREISHPLIWETTRFCLAPGAATNVSAALMLGGLELGLGLGLTHATGVFDARMVRVYRRLGWGPIILGADGEGRNRVSAGIWAFDPSLRPRILEAAKVTHSQSDQWFEHAFPREPSSIVPLAG